MRLSLILLLAGCGQPELNPDAYHWDVLVTGFADTCNAEPQGYSEQFVYSLSYGEGDEASAVNVGIGWDTFASGRISGCSIAYDSPVVGEDRNGGEVFVQWQMSGYAYNRQGGDACSMAERVNEVYGEHEDLDFDSDWSSRSNIEEPDAVDWIGVETFEIVNVVDAEGEPSDAFPVGCQYSTLVVGSYRPRE